MADGNYGTVAAVLARFPGRSITASTLPATATVESWIAEAEAEIDGVLAGAGFSVPVATTRGVSLLKAKVVSYVAARWKDGIAAGTDFEEDEGAARDMKEFRDFIETIATDPVRAARMLNLAVGSSGGPSPLRSYPTDNTDDESADDGDFDPVFTKSTKW